MDGDLIKLAKEGTFDLIAHGCNCKGLMGAGIAAQIAREFPMAKYADLKYKGSMKNQFGELHERAMLGSLSMYQHQKVIVLNLYTQIETGANFDLKMGLYPALCQIQTMFKRESKYHHKKTIGFPKIGAGIGGGSWEIINQYINSVLNEDFDITIVEYVPEPKKGIPAVFIK